MGIGKNNGRQNTDTLSKVLFQETQVLAEFVKEVIPEFSGFDRDEIVRAIEERDDYPRGLNTEAILPNMGTVEYDMLYRIPIPGSKGGVNILVNIESQSHPNPGYPLDNRGEFYVSSAFSTQKNAVFEHSDYGRLEKTYSVWVILNPPKHLRGKVLVGPRGWYWLHSDGGRLPPSLTNIVMLFMGDDEAANMVQILDLIRILLSSEDPKKKMDVAWDRFKIKLSNDYIERVRDMGEIEDGFYQAGVYDGMERGRQRLISMATDAVIKIMDLGQPLDKALTIASIPEDCIDEVKEQVLARISRS